MFSVGVLGAGREGVIGRVTGKVLFWQLLAVVLHGFDIGVADIVLGIGDGNGTLRGCSSGHAD